MQFRTDIEGLRAVAILPVVLYHANDALSPGGFVGVDIFFVISGFLITGLVLDAMERKSFSLANFYARRVRRIFPALFTMLIGASLAACLLLSPHSLAEFGRTLGATALFVSNIQFYRLSDYFGGGAEFKPLLHTWSLAVEEQFYIVFPLLLIAMRGWRRKPLALALTVMAGLSLAASVWAAENAPRMGFFLGPFRAFELLIGSVLATGVLVPVSGRPMRELFSIGGLAAIGISITVFNAGTPFPGWSALLPSLGAAALIYSGGGAEPTIAERLLNLKAVRFLGAISYSLYLWHWPALSLARHAGYGELPPEFILLVLAGTVLAAWLSWRFVERPFLLGAWPRVPLLAGAAGAIAAAAAVGALLFLSFGWPGRFTPKAQQFFSYAGDFSPWRGRCHDGQERPVSYAQSCIFGPPAAPVTAIWADSHGAELAYVLGDGDMRIRQLTSTSCPPALDFNPRDRPDCAAHNKEVLSGLTADSQIRTVILMAHYGAYSTADAWPAFRQGLERSLAALSAAGKNVVLVDPIPEFSYPVPEAAGLMQARKGQPNFILPLSRYEERNARALEGIAALTSRYGNRRIVTGDLYCSYGACKIQDGHDIFYFDDNHLSLSGARILAQAIRSQP